MALPERAPSAGALLREWRQRRNLSQLELALRSAVSARHLSFIETGRTRPSREMVLHLAERLDVPLRDRNRLLLAAGFAPVFGERSLDESDMAPVREAIEQSGMEVDSAELTMVPKTTVSLEDEAAARKTLRLIDALEESDDVQEVYSNFDIPERVMEAVAT